jgi:23S rRNA (adenine2030-N6)-methyltransferase
MNYRHAYHAGNFADVLKHILLIELVEHLKKKPTPFFYLDTHAGRGTYDLSLGESQRSGEYKQGIGRLLETPDTALPEEARRYVHLVRDCAGPRRSAITAYPGSPRIVAKLRRPTDRLVLAETHAREAQSLRRLFARQKYVAIVEGDGYAALKAQVPPREHRGLVLIDPPYEADTEFDRVVAALELGYERWPAGMYCVWYPLSDRASPLRFRRHIERTGLRMVLGCWLSVLPVVAAVGVRGSGLVIVNPPWLLDERLSELLPDLHRLLVPAGAGGTSVEWWAGE